MLHLPLLILLLQISSLELIFSSAYSPPEKYFINCGSKSSTNLNDSRTFVGDDSDPTLKLSHGKSLSVEDNNPSSTTPFLYHTARVYQKPTSYWLEIGENGTYIVRLHFFAFSSPSFNLSDAVFNVSASGFSLLSDFSTSSRASTNTTLSVLEFLLTITQGKLGLYFVPSRNSSFAFVNAIEVFLAPVGFIPKSASRVASSGSNGNYSGLLSLVLQTVHRINVGGLKITPENDTLWRTWIEDDEYLIGSRDFEYSGSATINYNSGNVTEYIAPSYVYNSVRFLNATSLSKQANFASLNWSFRANEKVLQHLVRVHFCDIISPALDRFLFSLFIYDKFERSIDPFVENPSLAGPFYFDFVVDSNGSRSINVSIGVKPQNYTDNPIAFLNGLEIFEIQNEPGPIPPPQNRPENKPQIGLIVGSVVSCAVVVGILISAFLLFKRRKEKIGGNSGFYLYGGSTSQQNSEMPKVPPNLSLKISFAEIQEATRNFHDELIIGEGGFGKVYKGTHKGLNVAVKRSKPGHGQGFDEFRTEIVILSQIRHLHLVSLVGYCDEGSEMILVYEFMENGTLRDHLYDSKGERRGSKFRWEKRLEVCVGAAKGLDYLHSDAANGILHRDVKSTNILLDENFVAKVADFGLSMTGIAADPNNADMVLKGSFGYFDPEYVKSSQYTEKSDVYSFGVVLLEVISARPAIFDLSKEEEKVSLAKWGMAWQRKGQLETIVDPFLDGGINPESLRVVGELAAKCLSEYGSDRPAMKDVVWSLEYALQYQRNAARAENFDYTATNASLESAFPTIRRAALPVDGDESRTELSGLSNPFSSRSSY